MTRDGRDDPSPEDLVLEWFRKRDHLLSRVVASAIASFLCVGLVVARTLVLVAEHHGTVSGCVAADVAILAVMLVVFALAWLPKSWSESE